MPNSCCAAASTPERRSSARATARTATIRLRPSDQTWHEPGPWDGALGTDPTAVLEQLTGGQPLATLDNPHGMDLFGQIGELAMHRILPQLTRAALLRVVAARPGIEVRTDVTDQVGRTGVAVTTMIMTPIAVAPLYRTLIFSPTTGELLATEKEFGTSASTAAAAPPRSTLPRPGIVLNTLAYTADTTAPTVACGPYQTGPAHRRRRHTHQGRATAGRRTELPPSAQRRSMHHRPPRPGLAHCVLFRLIG